MSSYWKRCIVSSTILITILGIILKYVDVATSIYFRLIIWNCIVSFVGYALTVYAIPRAKLKFPPCLQGRDLGRKGTPDENTPVPEGVGIISGAMFLVCLILCQLFYVYHNKVNEQESIMQYYAALLTICFGLLLGFCDDVLDIPHKYKYVIPAIASLPLLVSYQGVTDIVMPKPLRFLIVGEGNELTFLGVALDFLAPVDRASNGAIVKLGLFYHLYMLLLSVFCTNAINIYAGINGLEAGQSVIIGLAIIAMNCLELSHEGDPVVFTGNDEQHLMSLIIMIPFVATTLGLLSLNWWPARIFVGDTFTHFAGMTFAVAAILGHFSKTLLLLFVPQILNFLYSLPQLTRIIKLPRHRLPTFNPKTGLMHASRLNDRKKITEEGEYNYVNLTLINLMLQIFGPLREDTLCIYLLIFQVICCSLGLIFRYGVAGYVY